MGRIQSSFGLTTGLDIAGTVDQLISLSAQPRDRLQARIKGLETQQVAVNDLMALVIGVQLQASRLGTPSNLASTSVTSSRTEVLSATANGTPTPGTFTARTVQMAQTSTATSNVFTSPSDTVSSGTMLVRTGGFVDGSARLDELRGGSGIAGGRIRILDRSGASSTVDLRFASTLEDVIRSINEGTNQRVSARLQGDRMVLTDLTGQSIQNLVVEEVGEGRTASDLGLSGINVSTSSATGEDLGRIALTTRLNSLRDGLGVAFHAGTDLRLALSDGTTLNIDANATSQPTTVGQLLNTLNAVQPSKLEARIDSRGKGIELIDKTTGSATFSATGKLAEQLGLASAPANAGAMSGARIASSLSGPLLSSLRGGAGIGTPGSISITNRAGTSTVVDLSQSESLRDVIDAINAAGAGVVASLNPSKSGIALQDVTGSVASNLRVEDGDSNQTATRLRIAANVSANTLDSGSLDLQFVSESTELSRLNQGRGVRAGTIDLVNALGETRSLNLESLSDKTVGGVIAGIRALGIGLDAAINSTGDGIVVTDATGGVGTLTIRDRTGGFAARDLGIQGTGTPTTSGGAAAQRIEGSQNFRLDLDSPTSLTELVAKINQSEGPMTASLLTAGTSVRLLFHSRASGSAGRVLVDGSAIGIEASATSSGRDAILAISPNEESGGTLVRSSSNVFEGAFQGLSLTVGSVQPEPVEIRVSSDNSKIEQNLQLFVDQFNKVRERLSTVASFDPATGRTGILFGSNEVLRVEQGFARMVSQRISGSGSVRSLEQLGVRLDASGKLRFDKDKLAAALASNPEGVTEFFTKEGSGFAAKSKEMLESMAGVNDSLLVSRNSTLQRQIEDSNLRVSALNLKLDRERERLLRQFYRMEETIAKIRNSASSLTTLQSLAAGTQV
jgi:flagellar hook-associated protein 2